MCVALPARVMEVRDNRTVVEVSGARREVNALPVPGVMPGDYVLISMGMAVEILTPEEAQELEGLWDDIAQAQEEALSGGG